MKASSLRPSVVTGLGLALVVSMMVVTNGMIGEAALSVSSQIRPAQDEFIPLDEVPPEDQLPAAPLLVSAYGLIWVFVFGYLWSVSRRMSTVEQELTGLLKRIKERSPDIGDQGYYELVQRPS